MSETNNIFEKLDQERAQLSMLRAQVKARALEKTHLVKQARREVARILTQINKAGK